MPDIVLEIAYPINDPAASRIRTNAKPEAIEEILSAWISRQHGKGEDDSEPNGLAEYVIVIELDLSYDNFATRSNTGNKGLTNGIVIDVFSRLSTVPVASFN